MNASLSGLPFLMYLVLAFGYYTLMEGYLGQTVGKMQFGMKVVREVTGKVPGIRAAMLRTVLCIVDGLFAYLVAFLGKIRYLSDASAHCNA